MMAHARAGQPIQVIQLKISSFNLTGLQVIQAFSLIQFSRHWAVWAPIPSVGSHPPACSGLKHRNRDWHCSDELARV
jgi:hypothetical protein